ncbi:MAG TPA: toxin-antitoxin system YwqK family antitoxin [Perlabentimonas sp.]|nr:toxin-antitoxin system YwqK family antitoxin [Bacteroidales bacterium]MDD4672921.1 toxin-antitoxin system YwqK family antitoxin [Bacteroidales bacterium]MDY0349545.1 toxin-antitoxin system YwqK family antitoxin [Tenuifilaceae bacterium]HZJ74405.1 toxin-antitoxin system YwqK family antitoxin [Perlabentimonas sp.]
MKRFIILLLLTIWSMTCLAQTDTIFNQTDHLNRKQGYWKKHYKNGNTAYKGYFKNDKPLKTLTRYHENGIMSIKMDFSHCGDTAQAIIYNTLGRKVATGKYYKQQKHGKWVYTNASGKIIFSEEYKEGKKHGKFTNYFSTGEVFEEISWKNGIKDGPTILYFINGQIKSMLFYKNGKANGPIRLYYTDGNFRLEGQYKDGLKDGTWKFYDLAGNIAKQISYSMGKAANHDEIAERETKELEELLKNAGKIQEPSVEDFLRGQGR